MTDLEEPFVPLSEGLFVDPYESKYASVDELDAFVNGSANHRARDVISSLLSRIPKIFAHGTSPEPVLLPVLTTALSSLRSTGGKVVCALANLPTWGPGGLYVREDPKLHGTDSEKKLFATEYPAWNRTANKFAEAGVGVDFFIAAPGGAYMDIATIGKLSHFV